MRKPDFWNWPPFMTVLRHNREITILAERYQEAINREHARATREGQAQAHAWARDVNANLFYGSGGHPTIIAARERAALQQAEHMFHPARTDLKEVPDDTATSAG